MANQDIVQQLVSSVVSNPDLFSSLVEHPYSTLRDVTGAEEISKEEASEAVTAVSLLGNGKPLDFGNLAQIASILLSENGNSVHTMAANLLSEESTATPSPADLIATLANVNFERGFAGVDLSDGFGLDDVLGIAGALLGGKK